MRTPATQSSYSSESRRYRVSGFTLIEIIITVGLTLMVIGLTFSSLYFSARASKEARITTNMDFELMKLYGQMRQQLLNAYISPSLSESMIGRETETEHRDELYFFTSSPVVGRGIVEAAYRIKTTSEGTPYLAYREFPFVREIEPDDSDADYDDYTYTEDRWRNMSNAITGLELDFENDNTPYDEWKDSGLPRRIIVSLYYTADKKEQSFSFAVTPGIIQPSPTPSPSASASPAASPTATTTSTE